MFIVSLFIIGIFIFVAQNTTITQHKKSHLEYKIPDKMWSIYLHKNQNNEINPQYRSLKVPSINENQVLVKVKAASIGNIDKDILQNKMSTNAKIPCFGVAGIIVQTGTNVNNFYMNDEIFGVIDKDKNGACAQYAVLEKENIALKPRVLNYFNASSVPYSGVFSMQIFEDLKIKKGDVVVVNDALSGFGVTFVRIAKINGIKIVAIDTPESEKYLKNLGVDEFYPLDDMLLKTSKIKYNFIVDFSSYYNDISSICNLISKNGVFLTDSFLTQNSSLSCYKNLKSIHSIKPKNIGEKLKIISAYHQQGELTTKIAKVFSIRNFAAASNALKERNIDGKIVINIDGKY